MKIPSSVLGKDESANKEFISRCKAADDLFDAFALMFEKKLAAHKAESKSPKQYESASWPFYQADSIGYERALEEFIDLFKLKD